MTYENCLECGRPLTDPDSQERGRGRDCYIKIFGEPPRKPRQPSSRGGTVTIAAPPSAPVADQGSLDLPGLEHSTVPDLRRAAELVLTEQFPSPSFLMRRLGCDYSAAQDLLVQLEQLGVVGPPPGGSAARAVLLTVDELPAVLARIDATGADEPR